MTDVQIGDIRRRTVDLEAEISYASFELNRAVDDGLPARIAYNIYGVADSLDTDNIMTPGPIYAAANQLLDIVDQLDDYSQHATVCGILGLTAARLYRLAAAATARTTVT